MDSGLPAFYPLEDALYRLDADFSASEMHGIACGVLAVNNQYTFETWLGHVLKGDLQDFHFQEVARMLAALFREAHAQMNSNELALELLLPPEGEPMDVRMPALQKWCQGFAFGLAISGLRTMEDLAEDSRDWVQDVVKIGAARDLDLQDDEESEEAFQDLVEFMRVGVLMMNEETQPMRGLPELGDVE